MQLGIDSLTNGLVILFDLSLGMRVEKEDFFNIVLDEPVDGVVNGTEVSQFDKWLPIITTTLVLSKSLYKDSQMRTQYLIRSFFWLIVLLISY